MDLGLPAKHCCVAIMVTNGQLFPFGFITLLEPSFPVLHVPSYVIDSSSSAGKAEAAQHLHKFREFCRVQDSKLRQVSSAPANPIASISLHVTSYYQKPMTSVFSRCASKLQSILKCYEIDQKLHEMKVQVFYLNPFRLLKSKYEFSMPSLGGCVACGSEIRRGLSKGVS